LASEQKRYIGKYEEFINRVIFLQHQRNTEITQLRNGGGKHGPRNESNAPGWTGWKGAGAVQSGAPLAEATGEITA
jgi:hypothetical protein